MVGVEGQGAGAGPALLGDRQRTADEPRGWLAASHPPMPDLALTRQEIENIVRFSARPDPMRHTAATELQRSTAVDRENPP